MCLHVVQLMVMAVGTIGCGVVDLCGSESTILIAFVVLFVAAYKNRKFNIHYARWYFGELYLGMWHNFQNNR